MACLCLPTSGSYRMQMTSLFRLSSEETFPCGLHALHTIIALYLSENGHVSRGCAPCRLPSGNLTVVAMPWESTAAKHLISYLRQDAMWDAALDAASGWAPCVLQTYIRPYSAHVSQLMLERPSSVIGFQPIGHFLAAQILTQRAQAPDRTGDLSDTRNPNVNGEHLASNICYSHDSRPPASIQAAELWLYALIQRLSATLTVFA